MSSVSRVEAKSIWIITTLCCGELKKHKLFKHVQESKVPTHMNEVNYIYSYMKKLDYMNDHNYKPTYTKKES